MEVQEEEDVVESLFNFRLFPVRIRFGPDRRVVEMEGQEPEDVTFEPAMDTGSQNAVTVDVEAIRSAALEEGYRNGLRDAEQRYFQEGYREALGDLIERLRSMQQGDEWEACISAIEKMRG